MVSRWKQITLHLRYNTHGHFWGSASGSLRPGPLGAGPPRSTGGLAPRDLSWPSPGRFPLLLPWVGFSWTPHPPLSGFTQVLVKHILPEKGRPQTWGFQCLSFPNTEACRWGWPSSSEPCAPNWDPSLWCCCGWIPCHFNSWSGGQLACQFLLEVSGLLFVSSVLTVHENGLRVGSFSSSTTSSVAQWVWKFLLISRIFSLIINFKLFPDSCFLYSLFHCNITVTWELINGSEWPDLLFWVFQLWFPLLRFVLALWTFISKAFWSFSVVTLFSLFSLKRSIIVVCF